ncbi:MAD3 protein, partial [Casuarius casuarius]|nr:MAD3 protein [Casuarius casuarius]
MEPAPSSIQVLLQAAEFLERRERRAAAAAGTGVARPPSCLAEAEHGYASLCPARRPPRPRKASGGALAAAGGGGRPCLASLSVLSCRSVHNALEKHRYRRTGPAAGGREGSREGAAGCAPPGELRARRVKDRLRCEQQSLQQRLEQLLSPPSSERMRVDSLGSSQLSEHSGSDGEEVEIDVDGAVFGGDLLASFSTGRDHSYSSPCGPWS